MRVLVTGANGYLGAHLVAYLSQASDLDLQISGVVRQVPDHAPPQWREQFEQLIIGDICHADTLAAIMALQPDAVIHTVSLDHRLSQTASAQTVLEVNVQPTLALLKALTAQGLQRFIYFSTQQVYGRMAPTLIDEVGSAPNPLNLYGLTHLIGEQIVTQFHHTTQTTGLSLRLSNGTGAPVFWENNCWWLVVNDFCRTAHRQGQLKILSDGTPQRDFIAIADLVRAVGQLLTQPLSADLHPVLNLGSGQTYTIWEVAQLVAEVYGDRTGRELPILNATGQAFLPPSQDRTAKFTYNTHRMQQLGITCQQPLRTTIAGIFEYLDSTI
jgi:nucleoside-diphosphate-sugar epimerase